MHSVQIFPYLLPALFWFFMSSIATLTKGMINLIFNRASWKNNINHFLFLETALRKFSSFRKNLTRIIYVIWLIWQYTSSGAKSTSLVSSFRLYRVAYVILFLWPGLEKSFAYKLSLISRVDCMYVQIKSNNLTTTLKCMSTISIWRVLTKKWG